MDTKLVFKECLSAFNKKDKDYDDKVMKMYEKYLAINEKQKQNFKELAKAEELVWQSKKKISECKKQCGHIYNNYSRTCIVCEYVFDPDDEGCEYDG